MANPHPQKVERVRDIEMPTRERLLSLIKILQDFDQDRPIKKKDITGLLYYEYCNYVLSQLGKELKKAECESYSEADDIIYWLKDYNDSDYKNAEQRIYSPGTSSINSVVSKRSRKEAERKEKYGRLIEIAEKTDFPEKRTVYVENLINALYDIEDGAIIDCASTATLAADMNVLMDPDYDYVRSTGRSGVTPSERGVYGRFEYNLLDVWQLKILFETMCGIRFLKFSDIKAVTKIILHVTSASKLEDALSICKPHRLKREYYSRSNLFRENLKAIISAHINEHNVTFNYQHSTVNREEKVLDAKSPYNVFPVDIVFKDNFFYLLGADDSVVRAYRIDRIVDLEQSIHNPGFIKKHPEYADEKEIFFRNNTNNFSGGEEVEIIVRWDFDILSYYTPLFDVFGWENITQDIDKYPDDHFIIKTRDNYGMYLNLLRLGPVIEVVGPALVREKYSDIIRRMYDKHAD